MEEATIGTPTPLQKNHNRCRVTLKFLSRDKFICVYCGRKPPEVELHIDHKVSVRDGGSDDPENLVTACHECNGGKGASSV